MMSSNCHYMRCTNSHWGILWKRWEKPSSIPLLYLWGKLAADGEVYELYYTIRAVNIFFCFWKVSGLLKKVYFWINNWESLRYKVMHCREYGWGTGALTEVSMDKWTSGGLQFDPCPEQAHPWGQAFSILPELQGDLMASFSAGLGPSGWGIRARWSILLSPCWQWQSSSETGRVY